MKTTLLFLSVFLSVCLFGQSGRYYGNPSDASALCKIKVDAVNSFSSNQEAENALQRIIDVTGISKRFALYQCNGIDNCEALTFRGIRYIFYDANFMKSISMGAGSSWTNISILAHEVGHHVNAHALDLLSYETGQIGGITLAEKRRQELEADEFSGYVMYKLGATLYQAQAAINKFGHTGDDSYSTHPNKSKRLAAISRGYNKAKTEYDRYKVKTLTSSDYFYRAYNAKKENYQYKIDNYTKCIQLDPKQYPAFNNRANCYKSLAIQNYKNESLQKEYYEKAIRDYSRAISLKSDASYYFRRAGIYEDLTRNNNQNKVYYIKMAKNDYDKAISLNPNKYWYYRGRCNFHTYYSEDYLTAKNDATKCISLATEDHEFRNSYMRRATANEELGNYDLALNDIDMQVKYRNGESLFTLKDRGVLYEKKGDYATAIKYYEDAAEIGLKLKDELVAEYHQLPHIYNLKAKLCKKLGDYEGAIEAYTKMLELPHNLYCPPLELWYPEVYEWRASAYFKLGESKKVIDDVDLLISADYYVSWDHRLRAEYYMFFEMFTAALLDINKAIEIDKSRGDYNPNYYELRGQIKLLSNDFDGAIADFNSLIKTVESDNDLYYKLDEAYRLRGLSKKNEKDFEGALLDFNKAIQIEPNAQYYQDRGILKDDMEDYYGAISDYSKVLELLPNYAYIYFRRGIVKKYLKNYNGAISDYSKCISLSNEPNYLHYFLRGRAKDELEDYRGAIKDYTESINLNPKDGDSYYNRAFCKSKLNDNYGSISDYSKVIELSPKDGDAYLERGELKFELNDYDGAISDYSKAIEIDNLYSYAYQRRGSAKKKKGVPFCDDFKKACELGNKVSCEKIKTDCD
ncbi:M48 family metalloprotease [Crocinitomicaceae bacterium]|nr:M48 family metalloprotease [Crocinitomicaceae bacterium]